MHPNDGRVISNFVVSALLDQPITVYGDGTQTRSFCYVDDQVEAMIRFMATDDDVTGPINTGNPEEYTIGQLATKIVELTNTKAKVTYKPLPSDDPKQRCPDITVAERELGWRPSEPLESGLQKTIAYFDEYLKNAKSLSELGRVK